MPRAPRPTAVEIHLRTVQIAPFQTALSVPSFARISRHQQRDWPAATLAQARGQLRQTVRECAARLAAVTARRVELWPEGSGLRSSRADELLYADARALDRAGFDPAAFAAAGGDLLGFGVSLAARMDRSAPISYQAEYYPDDGALAWWSFFIAIDARFVLTLDAVYPFGLPPAAAIARLRALRRRWLFAPVPGGAGPRGGRPARCAARRGVAGSGGDPGR